MHKYLIDSLESQQKVLCFRNTEVKKKEKIKLGLKEFAHFVFESVSKIKMIFSDETVL